jgi:hypothetical protein
MPEKTFCYRTPTDIACANKEDVFHGSEREADAFTKLKANLFKSISGDRLPLSWSVICRFSQRCIAAIVCTVQSVVLK